MTEPMRREEYVEFGRQIVGGAIALVGFTLLDLHVVLTSFFIGSLDSMVLRPFIVLAIFGSFEVMLPAVPIILLWGAYLWIRGRSIDDTYPTDRMWRIDRMILIGGVLAFMFIVLFLANQTSADAILLEYQGH